MFESATKKGVPYEERRGAVIEDEVQPEVVWQKRVKDVEAERERRVVTSPGFSFSVAGLLLPYHLGVAQFLVEKGYIKVNYILVMNFLGLYYVLNYGAFDRKSE